MSTTEANALDELLYGEEAKDAKRFTGGLMGTWEISHYLGVERSRIARWLKELDEGESPIAAPVARLKSGPLFTFEAVEAKSVEMYVDAGRPYGETGEGRERWLSERRARRAAQP